MRQQVTAFSVHQTAKVAAALYAAMALLFVPIFYVIGLASGTGFGNLPFGGTFLLLLPVLYGVIGYVFVAIGCFIYNFVAGHVGGVEVELGSAGTLQAP